MDPWRYSSEGISIALRVTPRGGRDDIDGIETLANGRSVVKVRVRAIAEVFASGNFNGAPSEHVMQDMWEKWVFLASLAASTCLMRTSVGNILAVAGGKDFLLGMLDECSAIAKASGYEPTGPFFQRTSGLLTAEGSPMTASMFRDIKAGLPVEADHVIGDLVARGLEPRPAADLRGLETPAPGTAAAARVDEVVEPPANPASSTSSDSPAWPWIVTAAAGLGLLGVIAAGVRRRRRGQGTVIPPGSEPETP